MKIVRKAPKLKANEQICRAFAEHFPKEWSVDVENDYLLIFDANGKKVVDLEFDKNGDLAVAPKRKVGF